MWRFCSSSSRGSIAWVVIILLLLRRHRRVVSWRLRPAIVLQIVGPRLGHGRSPLTSWPVVPDLCPNPTRRNSIMITRFGSLFAGHVDLDNEGLDGTPVNDRWLSDEYLATVFPKSEAIAKLMDRTGYDIIFKSFNERAFAHQGKHYTIPPPVPYRGYEVRELTLVPRPKTLPVECWQPVVSASQRALDFMAKHGIKGLIGGGAAAGGASD